MTIIKIGDRYVNMDNVTNIGPIAKEFAGEDGILQIEYTGKNSEDWGSEWVEGDEALALTHFLDMRAADIMKQWQEDK